MLFTVGAASNRHGGSGGLGGGSVKEISTQCGTRKAAESAGSDATGGAAAAGPAALLGGKAAAGAVWTLFTVLEGWT